MTLLNDFSQALTDAFDAHQGEVAKGETLVGAPEWPNLDFHDVFVLTDRERLLDFLDDDDAGLQPGSRVDLKTSPLPVVDESQHRLSWVFVYKFLRSPWVVIEHFGPLGVAEEMSSQLDCVTIEWGFEKAAGSFWYSIYFRGELIEEFSILPDNPIYEGHEGQLVREAKVASGWKFGDNGEEFYSRRTSKVDFMDDLKEKLCNEMRLFIPNFPWKEVEGGHRICRPWSPVDFEFAYTYLS